MLIWTLVFSNKATLSELENSWSLDDALRASALLDYQRYIEEQQIKKVNNKHAG